MTIGEGFLYGCRDDVDGNLVVSSLRYYQVSIPFARLDELQVHRLYSLAVALDDPFNGLSAFNYVTGHYPHEPVVIVSINKNLDVHQLAEPRVGKYQDSLNNK